MVDGAGSLLPGFAVKQSRGVPDDVSGLVIFATVGFNDAEIFFAGTEGRAR
jgi:hypothetical protein